MEQNVIEPLLVKEQLIKAATEVASMILRIDDVIAASRLKSDKDAGGGAPSPYGGMGME